MKFKALQDNLRREIVERIDKGRITGSSIAEQIDVRQAHISNFLNKKRGLSLEAMDRVLQTQRLSVLDLLDPAEVNKRSSIAPPAESGFENVLLVDSEVAATEPRIMQQHVRDILKFKKGFLKRLRSDSRGRSDWTRFALIKPDPREGMSMYPRLLPGSTVLIDRHYNSLSPYRRGEASMYAVARNGRCTIKYVEKIGHNLVLRPHNQSYPIEVIPIAEGTPAESYIVGRICYVGIET